MRQLIAGNWKMHGLAAEAAALAGAVRDGASGLACELLVCPPFTRIEQVAGLLKGTAIGIGGQDCHPRNYGAYTGEVSAAMLADAGAGWVILGHSERRQYANETDALVLEKAQAATAAGLIPIICVGESEAERASGHEQEVVGRQVACSIPKPYSGLIAYEPVWAIGTGKSCSEADVAVMHAFIREALIRDLGEAGRSIRILYGGSVRPANAAGLLAVPEVGGALVGGASLVAADFLAVARAALSK